MLLAVDIGNTTISFGVLSGTKVLRSFFIRTDAPERQLRISLKEAVHKLHRDWEGIQKIIICSVVPAALRIIEKEFKKMDRKPFVIGRDIMVPIRNNYKNPKQVGQDRLVVAYAAKTLYGCPAIIIDFGTAITFDVVSGRGSYEGGIIIPGIRLSAESLSRKTALLPQIERIRAPRHLIGKDTVSSILSGLFYGYGVMSCGLIDLITQHLSDKPEVIVTGGHTSLMKKFIQHKIHKIDPFLVFKGMALICKYANICK